MAVKEILKIGNPQLRRKSREVNIETETVSPLIRDLEDTLVAFQREHHIGRAIAAPQIGILRRVIVMKDDTRRIAMINPDIIRKSEEMFEVWDSCFSADVAFFGKTRRHNAITVRFYDEDLTQRQMEFTGGYAELFQHEIDHLHGILFTDRIMDHQIIMRSEWEKRSSGKG